MLPPTHKSLPIPAPPTTCKAPLCVLIALTPEVIFTGLLKVPLKLEPALPVVRICEPAIQPAVSKYKLLAPIPPLVTAIALPAIVDVLMLLSVTDTGTVVVAPRLVIDCSVAVSLIVTVPVL